GGTIFNLDTSSGSFSVLHGFTGGAGDGREPTGGLAVSGTMLYGTTYRGGEQDGGTVFRFNPDTNELNLLHTFVSDLSGDGTNPYSGLVLSGSKLYGTTFYGGLARNGTVFSLNTNDDSLEILHNFAGGPDGLQPIADLAIADSKLYGTTSGGGDTNLGAIFV